MTSNEQRLKNIELDLLQIDQIIGLNHSDAVTMHTEVMAALATIKEDMQRLKRGQ